LESRSGGGHLDPAVELGEEEIEEFYGQLWAIPSATKPVRVPAKGFLAWIRRDLVEAKSFTIDDCFPVKRSDRIEGIPKRISFLRDIWEEEQRRLTYLEAVRGKMAEERGRWVWQPEPARQPPPRPNQRPPHRDPHPIRHQQQRFGQQGQGGRQAPPEARQPGVLPGGRQPQPYHLGAPLNASKTSRRN